MALELDSEVVGKVTWEMPYAMRRALDGATDQTIGYVATQMEKFFVSLVGTLTSEKGLTEESVARFNAHMDEMVEPFLELFGTSFRS